MFSSIDEVIERFAKNNYIASRRIATVIYLASSLKKPILVEGPAGVGKTDLAKVLAASLGHDLIRLQCYEGLDEGKALYEWEYAKQLLYTQILKDKISEVLTGAKGLAEAVDRIAREEAVCAAGRRNRQGGCRVRGVSARIAFGFPDFRTGAGHPDREAHSPRYSHFE